MNDYKLSPDEQNLFEVIEQIEQLDEDDIEEIELYLFSVVDNGISPDIEWYLNLIVYGIVQYGEFGSITENYSQSSKHQLWLDNFSSERVFGNPEHGLEQVTQFCRQQNNCATVFRKDYYAYLVERGDEEESFAQHLKKYGGLFCFTDIATEAELAALTAHYSFAPPTDLKAFYCHVGGLHSDSKSIFNVFSAPALLKTLDSENPHYSRLYSVGIVDTLNFIWGNSKEEFSTENGVLTQQQINDLNSYYHSVGYFQVDDNTYCVVYFDQAGKYGVVLYDQDNGGIFNEYLIPMLKDSQAQYSLAQILSSILVEAFKPYTRYEQMVEWCRNTRLSS